MRRWMIFSGCLVMLLSCRKEVDIFVDEDPITEPPTELVVTSIYGQVVTEYALPVPDVVVKIRDYEVRTDANGYFEFDKIQANKFGTQIVASKEGFVRNILMVYPRLNQQMFRTIILAQNVHSATFMTSNGVTLDMGSQTTLIIPPKSIVYASDGSDFSGTVRLNWKIHQITDKDFLNLIPGELTGLSISNKRKGLSPVGVIRMEMTDDRNLPLRLAQGKTARLQFKVPASYKGELAEKIPFWYYDTKKNRWIESVEGLKNPAQIYAAEIPSITDWCLANPIEIVTLTGRLSALDGTPLNSFSVVVTEGLDKTEMETDDSGFYYGNVPANKPLTMEIYNDCGYLVKNEAIGIVNSDTELDKKLEESSDCRIIPVDGILVNCNDERISNGYVFIKTKATSYFLRTDHEGRVSGHFRICGDITNAEVGAMDYKNNVEMLMDLDLFIGHAVQLGYWKVCDQLNGYISMQFNDHVYLLNEMLTAEIDAMDAIFSARSSLFEIECFIYDFRGEGDYFISSESTADFILTFTPFGPEAPKLYPKDVGALSTYKLTIKKYVANQVMQGEIQGLARDENNNNQEGMMYLKFSIPLKKK